MKKSLINIDYTNDFVADDGALTSGEVAQKIESEIVKITNEFISNNDYVVFAIDSHETNDKFHPESKLFPPHNIKGTEGQQLYGSLKDTFEPSNPNIYWMNKTRYSAFAGTDLEIKLRERGITEVHIVGIMTDICVLHTCVDAFNKGFKIVVHKNAVASINEAGHKWSLEHFEKTLGATLK